MSTHTPRSGPDDLETARRKAADPALLERIAEAGFLAAEYGLDEQAERIFQCLVQLRPGRPSPLIALAMVHARRGWIEQAIEELRQVMAQFSECDLAKAMLGMVLLHARQPGALQLFEEVIANGSDAGAVGVANCCIGEARARETAAPQGRSESFELFRHYNVRP